MFTLSRFNFDKRPNKLAESHSPARDYVIHALDHINRECNYFCILQPTSPFTLASDIDNAINLIYEKKCESVVSVMKVDHAIHPVKLKRIKGLNYCQCMKMKLIVWLTMNLTMFM